MATTLTIHSMTSLHQSLDSELGANTDRIMSSPHQSLDRELSTATDNNISMTSHQAAHAVLFTNELLCDIIAQLPPQDIVVATGICKFWCSALSGNEHIQAAMFLKPVEMQEAMVQDYLAYCLTRPIPLDRCLIIGKVNPSLAMLCRSITVDQGDMFSREQKPFPELRHQSGTWREMFITQPPCKRVVATISKLNGPFRHLQNSAGIKLGELYDHIRANLAGEVAEHLGEIVLGEFAVAGDLERWEDSTVRCQIREGVVIHPGHKPSRPVINPYSGIEDDFTRSEDLHNYEDDADSSSYDDSDGVDYDDEDFQDENFEEPVDYDGVDYDGDYSTNNNNAEQEEMVHVQWDPM